MTVATDAVIRASARFVDANGSDHVNVYFFQADFTGPQDDLDVFDAVDDYLSSVYLEFDQELDATFDCLDLKVDVVVWDSVKWAVTQNIGFGSWGVAIGTTATGDALPPGIALLGYLRTGLGKHTGKKFFGGFTVINNGENGNVEPGGVAAVVAGLIELLTPFVFNTTENLVAKVLDHTNGTIRDIIEVGASTIWAYQRRRRPGTGS